MIVKAAPESGQTHGETVCVAGIDLYGNWHRLYPMPFKLLQPDQRFNRWDIIRTRWRSAAPKDSRPESKRIDHESIIKVREVKKSERHEFARRAIVKSLSEEKAKGRSFALIRPENPEFIIRPLSEEARSKNQKRRNVILNQLDIFSGDNTVLAKEVAPYSFHYRFTHEGKILTHTCIDWETEQTFFKWRGLYGEAETLRMMRHRWGQEMPERGIAFAMGTHRVTKFNKWLLSGVVRVDHSSQANFL
ncbi:hypothetical protein [Roseicyclus mahoneyensis]|uniref:Uncharacterized protein n=1 Tax=Roseicyclus mahoneyensis TaxID=164332 RepID=A0A316GFF7_9RHOB|nr:hypothetical protein [Roseicyclus mahoneyensis]PWK59620.1 hypothetical protein C7455_107165 [Roseicyclus mahoneyensis]